MYILWSEPAYRDFRGCVQNERLGDCADNLSDDDEIEGFVDHAANACTDGRENSSDDNSFFDALGVENPVGREVDEHVGDHVAHWDD